MAENTKTKNTSTKATNNEDSYDIVKMGSRFRKVIKEDLKMTQQAFAEKYGLNLRAVSRYCSGECEVPNYILFKLKTDYNISSTYIICGTGTSKPLIDEQMIIDKLDNIEKLLRTSKHDK